jgi:hypothetical protein
MIENGVCLSPELPKTLENTIKQPGGTQLPVVFIDAEAF